MIRLDNQPIIKGQINGRRAYFLVDTGSDITMLNLMDAKKYGFKISKSRLNGYVVSGLQSQIKDFVLHTCTTELLLGETRIKRNYKVFDLSHIIESIRVDTGIRINGIIGSDLMKRYHFLIDYQAKEIRLNKL